MAINAVGRTTIQGATTVGGFNPATLFSAGEQGVWFDPSDLSTLFQDSAGTIPVTALEQPVGRMLDKSGRGNTATQATSANRPVVSARVNLLTYSQTFSNAVWATFGTGASKVGTASSLSPIGTSDAYEVSLGTVGGTFDNSSAIYQNFSMTNGVTYTFSLWVRAKTGSTSVRIGMQLLAIYNSGDVTVTTDWQRISVTGVATTTGGGNVSIRTNVAGNSANVFIWGADLRPTNQGVGLPVYQRVGAAVAGTSTTVGNADYNANGFPVYLSFDGGDSLATGNINFSATDKMTVFAGERKTSDVNQGMFAELSVAGASNNGTFSLFAPLNAGIGNYGFRSRGDGTTGVAATASSYPAPITNILTGIGDIAADNMTLRVNGSVAATDTGDQGTGNFGTYPIYIGARAGTSQYFNGNLYGLIVRGASSTANQITGAENWLNQKTAAY